MSDSSFSITIPASQSATVVTWTVNTAAVAAPTTTPTPTPTPVPVPPKMSIGTNVPSNDYINGCAAWCDVTKQMTGWYGVGGASITSFDANGYPMTVANGNAGCFTYLYAYPSGVYTLNWTGPQNALFVQGKSLSNALSDGKGGWTATVQFNTGDRCELRCSGGVTNISLLAPDAKPGQTFRDAYVAQLKQFKVIRLMPFQRVNGTGLPSVPRTDWSKRTLPTSFCQTNNEVAFEHCADLCRQAGAIPWICVPYGAPDDYVAGLANIFKEWECPLFELSNELWNYSPAYQGNQIRAAGVATGKYGADPNVAGAKLHADLLVNIAAIVRKTIPKAKIVAGAQMAWDAWATNLLSQAPKGVIDYLAIAPYFQNTGADPVGTITQVATSCQNWNTQVMIPGIAANAKAAKTYGCGLIAYEAGQSLIPAANNAPPVEIQWQADISPTQYAAYLLDPMRAIQTDPAMGTLYDAMFKACYDAGMSLVCHFMSPGGGWGRSGCWSTKQQTSDPDNVKDKAIARAIATYP